MSAALAGGVVVLAIMGAAYYAGAHYGASGIATRAQVTFPRPAVVRRRPPYGELDAGIAYGSTPANVLSRLGAPTVRTKGCWVYRGARNPRGRYADPGADAMRFCFSDGPTGAKVVTSIDTHTAAHITEGRYVPAHWGHAIVIVPVPPSPVSDSNV